MDAKAVCTGQVICSKLFATKVHWIDNDTLVCAAYSLCLYKCLCPIYSIFM